MKRLTLENTWKYCLSMWRWIAKRKREDDTRPVGLLKAEWIKNHGFDEIMDDCFFCHYIVGDDGCRLCPGKRIDKEFDCASFEYCWISQPIAFYNKLVSLDRKRKKKRRGQ